MKPGQRHERAATRSTTGVLAAVIFFGLAMSVPATAIAKDAPASSMTGLTLSADQPIKIDADRLEVHEKDSTAVFTGNVTVVQDKTLMKSGKLVVYYVKGSGGSVATGSAAIDHVEATDKVYVKSDQQVATGDRATFDMKSQLLVMEGSKVVLTDGDNVAVGCKLTVYMQTGEAKLDGCAGGDTGRVSIVVTPRNLPQAAGGQKTKGDKTSAPEGGSKQ